MLQIDVQNMGPLRQALKDGAAVLLTPNHSFHYDSYVLFEASDRLGRPFHFLTAWQVFAMSNRFERWSLPTARLLQHRPREQRHAGLPPVGGDPAGEPLPAGDLSRGGHLPHQTTA